MLTKIASLFTLQFAGKNTSTMEAITDAMVLFYRDQAEAMERLIRVFEEQNKELRIENREMRDQMNHLESQLEIQEARSNAMHDVVNTMIDNTFGNARRDLMEAFNEVADRLGVDLEIPTEEDFMTDSDLETLIDE